MKDLWMLLDMGMSDRGRENKFGSYCVATRMSWASARQSTRAEDMAYCLLGIFNINMPLLYGEGDRAFRRLQEEIIRKIDDDSILAWALSPEDKTPSPLGLISNYDRPDLWHTTSVDFLAHSPKDFKDCADLSRRMVPSSLFTLTNTGLQIQLPIVQTSECSEYYCRTDGHSGFAWIGLLGCSRASNGNFLGILLCPEEDDDKSSVRVIRQRNVYSTVVVGPRVAFGAVGKTLTIVGRNGFQEGRDLDYEHKMQVIVNECKAIRSLGYQLRAFIAWEYIRGKPLLVYHPLWDPEAKILTLRENDPFDSMFEFSFETWPSDHNPNFTVFVNRSGRGRVREGDVFSEDERFALFGLLIDDSYAPWDKNRVYDKGDVLVLDDKRRLLHIKVDVHTKAIGHHDMVRVNVDALRDGFSDEDPYWRCNCAKHIYSH